MSYGLEKRSKRQWFFWPVILLVIAGAAAGSWLHWHHKTGSAPKTTSPVPVSIAQAVNFPIYYPDPKKLPPGYRLNVNSFNSPVKNGVTYSVSYDNSKKIVFSLQEKPSENELTSFDNNYIPLRIDYQTIIGQAEIGAYNNHGNIQTLVSLPTRTNAWIIITAPYNINQDELKHVLNSLKQ